MRPQDRRTSLLRNKENSDNPNFSTHAAKRMAQGLEGRLTDCTITGYCQTRVFEFLSGRLVAENLVAPCLIYETDGFRAVIVSDIQKYFESVSDSQHYSIDLSLRVGVKNLWEKKSNECRPSEVPVFIVMEEVRSTPETPMNKGECFIADEGLMLEKGRPGKDIIIAVQTIDGSWPDSSVDLESVNAVLTAIKVEQNITYHIKELVSCFCYVNADWQPVYPIKPRVNIGYGGLRVDSKLCADDIQTKADRIRKIICGLKADRQKPEISELIDAILLEDSQDDKYFRLWYLRLWQAAKDASSYLGFRQFENRNSPLNGNSSPRQQTEHRNAIAHWWTGKVDFSYVSDLQKTVLEMLRRKYCKDAETTSSRGRKSTGG